MCETKTAPATKWIEEEKSGKLKFTRMDFFQKLIDKISK